MHDKKLDHKWWGFWNSHVSVIRYTLLMKCQITCKLVLVLTIKSSTVHFIFVKFVQYVSKTSSKPKMGTDTYSNGTSTFKSYVTTMKNHVLYLHWNDSVITVLIIINSSLYLMEVAGSMTNLLQLWKHNTNKLYFKCEIYFNVLM